MAAERSVVPGMFKWSRRPAASPGSPARPALERGETLLRSKILPKFLAAVAKRSAPVVVDLGPVVGPNIAFFGDRLACKIFIEDVFADIEACARRGDRAGVKAALLGRMTREAASVDGILCWDVFDYLDRDAARALAARLVSQLKPGGVLYGLFSASPGEVSHYSRFFVESDTLLKVRQVPASPHKRTALVTRDIDKMFHGLVTSESVLLKTHAHEILFRKP